MKRLLIPVSACAVVALPIAAALAAGPYDGTWQFDAAPAGQTYSATERSSGCEGLRLRFTVKDSQIHGQLARSPYGGGRVTEGGRGATPVSGTVNPDGTFRAEWQKFKATGKLSGENAEMRWRGTCGERVATGGRVASSGSTGPSTR